MLVEGMGGKDEVTWPNTWQEEEEQILSPPLLLTEQFLMDVTKLEAQMYYSH